MDSENNPLPFVNIYLENSYKGTTSNDDGNYELEVDRPGDYVIVFQYLGYETLRKPLTYSGNKQSLSVTLFEATLSLDEVVLSAKEDPAYRIIRNTIAQQDENLNKISSFTADFYSRGIWRVDSIPERIFGQEVGNFDGALDSTRTGIIYLSETISKIAFKKPDDFKETILASKLSGNDNGFSFNSAQEANFSFYENTLELNAEIVSPIASNALTFYNYKLDGVFYEGSKLINRISVIPKRSNDRVWKGYIYIVEDDWQLYGVDLTTTGAAIQVPFIKELVFKHNFSFDTKENAWVKRSQTIDFSFGFFGFDGDGRFIAVYSNYDFQPEFNKNSFNNEVLFFDPSANKKDSIFWEKERPIKLTEEEINDYQKKDSLQEKRKSKTYLDSVDSVNNRFKVLDFLTGYSFKNSYNKWELSYEAPLPDVSYNTVQGWNGDAGITFFKWYDDYRTKWWMARFNATYGISEDRLRFTGNITKRFNAVNDLQLTFFGGSEARQFNSNEPISPFVNAISSLFFERNYMKLFELNYGGIAWSQELFNGVRTNLSVSYQERKNLFNTTDYVIFPWDDHNFSSNNPLDPTESTDGAFIDHHLIKTLFRANITFGQKYMTYPDGKFNIGNDAYPRLFFEVENAMGADISGYNYTELKLELSQKVDLNTFGDFHYRTKGGTFFNGDAISFVDFHHFNGNQTRVGSSDVYTNVFNLMPYYSFSTNKSFAEIHAEHHFKGWVTSKIPGLNWLNFHLIVGGHALMTEDRKPYQEFSIGLDNIGWGKYRLLRLDYVTSHYGGQTDGAFVFGLKFLNIID